MFLHTVGIKLSVEKRKERKRVEFGMQKRGEKDRKKTQSNVPGFQGLSDVI